MRGAIIFAFFMLGCSSGDPPGGPSAPLGQGRGVGYGLPEPPASVDPEFVPLTVGTVRQFIEWTEGASFDSEVAYGREQIAKARGNAEIESAILNELNANWSESKIANFNYVTAAILVATAFRSETMLPTLNEKVWQKVPPDDGDPTHGGGGMHMSHVALQGMTSEAVVCVPGKAAGEMVRKIVAEHPEGVVRETAARAVQHPRCDFLEL